MYMDNIVILGHEMTSAVHQLVAAGKEMVDKLNRDAQIQKRIANSLERLEKHFTDSLSWLAWAIETGRIVS